MGSTGALAYLAAIGAPLAALLGLAAAVIGTRNHSRIADLRISIDGRMEDLLAEARRAGSIEAIAIAAGTAATVAASVALDKSIAAATPPTVAPGSESTYSRRDGDSAGPP
jgi:hypothetical protein